MSAPVGLQIKAFNHPLRRAREAQDMSLPQLARASGVSYSQLLRYEYLRAWPKEDHQVAIAWALERGIDDLFPEDLERVSGLGPTTVEVAVTIDQVTTLLNPPSDDPILLAERTEVEGAIEAALGMLTDRERKVINIRFGLESGHSMTLDDCAKDMKVSPERVRQIEQKALRKLRHPVRDPHKVMRAWDERELDPVRMAPEAAAWRQRDEEKKKAL